MLKLTHLRPSELQEWNNFHQQHQSQFIKERNSLQLEASANNYNLYVIRDDAGKITNTCGCFDYEAVDRKPFKEIGAVRVLNEGFGLQVLLMNAAFVSSWMFDPPSEPIIAITSIFNLRSAKNIQRAGFVPVKSLSSERMASMQLEKLDEEKLYFEQSITTSEPIGAKFIREIGKHGKIMKNDRSLPIQIDLPIMEVLMK